MDGASHPDLTRLIGAARDGRGDARAELVGAIYGEMRRMAGALMGRERPDHTLQPSALVHEALLRLFDGATLKRASDRRYLFAAAAQAMRQALVDHARKRKAAKRDGGLGREREPLDAALAAVEARGLDVLAVHEAVDRLMVLDERQGLGVVLRFFAGLTAVEAADVLDVSLATVEADWRFARAWLRSQLNEDD